MTALGFTWWASGLFTAVAAIQIGFGHHYGWGILNGTIALVAAVIAWGELR